ncbi:MAG: hypothetical protein ISS82_05005 [Nanoarchaeota archaeon]|nr:hypothetical protein [Nanoarchaeota archaeon]
MLKKVKKEFVFSFLILVILLILFGSFGLYDNKITGMASFDFEGIASLISGSLNLIKEGIGEPFFTALAEDDQGIFMRIILWIIIFLILRDVMTINKNMKRSISERTGSIIAGLIALISVTFMPQEIIRNFGPTLSVILLSIPIILGIKFIWSIDKGQEDSFTRWKKAFFTLLLILVIMMINGWAEEFFKASPGQIFGIVSGIGFVYSIFYLIYLVFFAGRGKGYSMPKEKGGGGLFRSPFGRKEKQPQQKTPQSDEREPTKPDDKIKEKWKGIIQNAIVSLDKLIKNKDNMNDLKFWEEFIKNLDIIVLNIKRDIPNIQYLENLEGIRVNANTQASRCTTDIKGGQQNIHRPNAFKFLDNNARPTLQSLLAQLG